MKIRTIIIDDEPLARMRIRNLVAQDLELDIVAEAKNGMEANQLIAREAPDLIFLDIQMPDYDGFSVLSKVSEDSMPIVVFVTAFDEFAIQAFECNATDYLLKPFDDQRFYRCVKHAKQQLKLKQVARLSQNLKDLIASYEWEQTQNPVSIPIKKNGVLIEVPVTDIFWIEAQGNYVKLQLESQWYLHRSTLSHLQKKLVSSAFLRIHRGLLINTRYLSKVSYQQNNEYRLSFTNGAVHTSSRSYKKAIGAYLLEKSGFV